jgi:transglutaminase-like putative cysteine protease
MFKLFRKKNKSFKEQPAAGYKIQPVNWPFWLNAVLLYVVLEIAVFSVEKARWISPQPSLTLTLTLSLAATLFLIRTKLHRSIIHLVLIASGLLVTLAQAQPLLSTPGFIERLRQVINGLQPWSNAASSEGGPESLLFAAFLVLLTWLSGYLSAWFLVKKRNAWVGAALAAVVLIVNLSNLNDNYYFYLPLFLIAGVLFIAQTRTLKNPNQPGFGKRGWTYMTAGLLAITMLSGSIAWFSPELRAPGLQNFVATHTLWQKDVAQSRINFFNAVPAKQVVSASTSLDEQSFQGGWHQSDTINYVVKANRPAYWRVHVYDTYTAGGWVNSPASETLLGQKVLWDESMDPASAYTMTYSVKPNVKTDITLLAGNFMSADNPTLVQVSAGEISSVTMPRIFKPGEQYTVTSSYYSPSSSDLSRSTRAYPQEIKDYYLQLPSGFPRDITSLARSIAIGTKTPYDKVLAINKYLAKIPYQANINAPPAGTDPVEYFIFTQKSGFCLYYASAMATMLRSVGVPARLAIGYLPGDPGEVPGQYLLRDKHYHAWPQIYFSSYGWVDFEATPGGGTGGLVLESPWVSTDILAQLPQWDQWVDSPSPEDQILATPDSPTSDATGKAVTSGQFFFAPQLGIAVAVILLGMLIALILATPILALRAAFYSWLWHVDRDGLASLAYDKLCSLAARVGLGPRPYQTPLEFAAALSREFPEQADAFDHIARRYVEDRFGHKVTTGLFEEAELLKARCGAFGALAKRLGLAGELSRVKRL